MDDAEATWAIGIQTAGSTQTSSAITVTNDGNVTETFQLNTGSSANWANANAAGTGNSAGVDLFVLRAVFDGTAVSAFDANDDVTNTATSASTTRFSDGDDSGAGVGATTSKELWLQLVLPTSDTSGGVSQTITLTVTAVAS